MKFTIAAALLGLFASQALAQPISITGVDCSRLVRHTPSADVEYKPGVDVKGRAVAPADLSPASPIRAPETIIFDAAADLRRFGIPPSSPLFQPHVGVGLVRVERDGRVFFNGQPLQDPEIAALEEFCRRRAPAGR